MSLHSPSLPSPSLPSPSSPSPSSHFTFSLQSLGLGYFIAIAFGFLLLLSTLLLSSYLCFRSCSRHNQLNHAPAGNSSRGIIVPRVFFVAEDDETNDATSGVVGLERAVISSYPKFQYVRRIESNVENNGNENNENMCSICLCEYKENEMLRMMPDCKHYFHLCCLDAWLKLNGSCPVCRNSPLPTPVSTPLAEVMPLSLYPDNRRRSAVVLSS